MAFVTGTATGFNDLLDRLVAFLTTDPNLVAANQQYEVIFDQTAPYPSQEPGGVNRRHVVFKHRGLSNLDGIYTAISTRANVASDYYNWRIQGGTGFSPAGLGSSYPDLSQNAGLINQCTNVHLCQFWDQPMSYWFVANGRRWWVVAKVAVQYESCGAGFILPSSAPSRSPYPLALWGSHSTEATRWSDVSVLHQSISTGRVSLRLPTGVWQIFRGYESYLSNLSADGGGQFAVLPTGARKARGASAPPNILNLRDSMSGAFLLFPLTLVSQQFWDEVRPTATFGEADGVFFCPTMNNGPEDIIQISGVDYVVFSSAGKSGAPYLFALRMS